MAPEQLLNLAADARRDSDWPRALEFYGQLLAQHPGHPTAVRERALTLQQQGAVVEAWRQYRERPTLFKPGEALGFELDALAKRLNWAQLQPDPQAQRTELEAILLEYEALQLGAASEDEGALARVANDRLLTLQLLGRHAEVEAEIDAREAAGTPLPAWLEVPVADSLMAQRDPERAEAQLHATLDRDPDNSTTTVLQGYALLEQERHADAREVLKTWLDANPPFDDQGAANWARPGVELNDILVENFSEQIDSAYQRILQLSELAPLDAGLQEARAGIERRRGWPQAALVSARIAATEAPDWVLPRVAELEALLDLDRDREARERLEALLAAHPAHRQTRSVQERWARRQGAQWAAEALRAQSNLVENGGGGPLGPGGSGEFRLQARWEGPLLDDAWRLGANLGLHWADFQGQRIERNRAAATVSWRQDQWSFGAEAGRTFDDFIRETGVGMWTRYRHSDQWRGSLGLWRHAPFASLQARAAGIRADGLQFGLVRSPDERSRSGLSLEQLRYEDGNVRSSAYLSHRQQLLARPRGEWYARLGVGGGRATREDAPYFNPRRDASADLGLTHDRLLWRDYGEAFRLRVDLDVSRGWQDGFGSHWTPAVEVMPRWLICAGHEISLGLRWSRPVYDGRREERWALVLRMGGGE